MEDERRLLLSYFYVFSNPHYGGDPFLLHECQRLGSQYCKRFNDRGMDSEYNELNNDTLISEIISRVDEDTFLSYFNSHKENIKCHRDFFGRYYTLLCKEKVLENSSVWYKKREEIENILSKYPGDAIKVLSAIYYVSVEKGTRFKNYYMVKTEAESLGFSGKNWFKILSELQLAGIIPSYDYKDLEIHEEIAPLIGEILNR
ncbi:hypothetical protein [Thermoplasma acidophilum]|uniref:Uncharacterized protein n=2 Tax=Thermoplasma acidophilum TaxID=2303 RepID=Q9HIF2_THEAC|nr:hypothetical protein [Thermoplasma acidophilum]